MVCRCKKVVGSIPKSGYSVWGGGLHVLPLHVDTLLICICKSTTSINIYKMGVIHLTKVIKDYCYLLICCITVELQLNIYLEETVIEI